MSAPSFLSEVFVVSYNKKGKTCITGGPALKRSQQYPIGYGTRLATLCAEMWRSLEASSVEVEATIDGKPATDAATHLER